MQYGDISALGPDRCRDDRCTPCFYWHLKLHAMNGGRDKLAFEDLEYVGVVSRRRDVSGGWRQPNTAAYEVDSILSAEDTALLQALMDAGSVDRVEFLA